MKKKYLIVIGYTFFMIPCSENLWGQHGVLLPEKQEVSEITPRRVSGPNDPNPIDGPKDVGGPKGFGAGESAAVKSGVVTWPANNNNLQGSISIGSAYSRNVVIGIYDNNGLEAGKVHGIRLYGNNGNDTDHIIINYEGDYSKNNIPLGRKNVYAIDTVISAADAVDSTSANAYLITQNPPSSLVSGVSGQEITGSAVMKLVKDPSGNVFGAVLKPYFNAALGKYVVPIWNHFSMNIKEKWNAEVVKQDQFTFDVKPADTLYTSTRDSFGRKDDGKQLFHAISGFQQSETAFSALLQQDTVEYVRPTTVLLSGANYLNDITIGDLEWSAGYFHSVPVRTDTLIFYAYNAKGCTHLSGWASYLRDSVQFNLRKKVPSTRLVDAAVRLLDGSDVSVNGSISDKTSTPYSLNTPYCKTYGVTGPHNATDAVLVLPGANDYKGQRSNFRLKIGGDANILHTQDSGFHVPSDPFEYGYLYRDANNGAGPGAAFPTVQTDIFLSGGTNLYSEVNRMNPNYPHPREAGALTGPEMPYTQTKASVYGVKGSYGGRTYIHTRSVDGNDTTGIIELGSGTDNQHFFKIYSNGMLKNFRLSNTSPCDSLVLGGDPGTQAPGLYLNNDAVPLYILNDGYCCESGIRFNATAIDSISNATANATGGGGLHIQAHSFVKFYGADLHLTHFASTTIPTENSIRILSDSNAIYMEKDLLFTQADSAHLTLWAKGPADANRGYSDLSCSTGAVRIDGNVTAKYNATKNGKGLLLLRSDNDDVLIGGRFEFENRAGKAESGELMVQAGQDVRIDGATVLTHDGQRSMLFEAQKTAAFGGPFRATMGGAMKNGDLTIKAGYHGFLPVADVRSPLDWGLGTCVAGGYANCATHQPANVTGGDILFKDSVAITLTPPVADSVDTYIRAFNSIHIEGDFNHTLASTFTPGGDLVDTTLLFAETGNVEAMNKKGPDVTFNIGSRDSTYLLLQAGNPIGDPCGATTVCSQARDDEWHGNILFGKGKTLTVNHEGVGPVRISAARDIEHRTGANVTFRYKNPNLGNKDNLLITAGRHIETHAPYLFDYSHAGESVKSDITMQAGHAAGCNYALCKTTETASNLFYNGSGNDNAFASGGAGRGSILLFDSTTFNYKGQGAILLTAKNGNIENDPHLHGRYTDHSAALIFNHSGTGVTRMEAIDIKLHDLLVYNGHRAKDRLNGRFHITANDSILTRSLYYKNETDTGSVYITTDKYKAGADCDDANLSATGAGIHQGHIVLGYGADCDAGDDRRNRNDSIVFDFSGNDNLSGANVYIRAGYPGFDLNRTTGKANTTLFQNAEDRGKGYGGNITFDFLLANMAKGNHSAGGYMELSTPNGNIWGKDSLNYHAYNGDLLVDAGVGSPEDTPRAVRWSGFNGRENTLNTNVALNCGGASQWRTGNIMMKGAMLDFNNGRGNAVFRTREGFIDTYDAFTVRNMEGHLLKYAGADNATVAAGNQWGDVSERDFRYTPGVNSGSVFFGADDNIMLNYGYSNANEPAYGGRGRYDVAAVTNGAANPYYPVTAAKQAECRSVFDVNKNGYMWYRHSLRKRSQHILYRGCEDGGVCSPVTGGACRTSDNHARDFELDFSRSHSGGFAAVARNYIDVFTKFTYHGGAGSGLHAVPGMGNLRGEDVRGYGLYMKSQFDGTSAPEKRRATCEDCGERVRYPIQGRTSTPSYEWTYIGFHDDARIYTQNQKSRLEAPVIEFFGHAELDSYAGRGAGTKLTLKGDSLIFHDSVVFSGTAVELLPYTVGSQRQNDMRYGVVNDEGSECKYYHYYGRAIEMPDRNMPVIELGYQRCTEPSEAGHSVSNATGQGSAPTVGGDVIVTFKRDFTLPICNSVVANHARISFVDDLTDRVQGGEFTDAFIRTDLLRIRNRVEFYTDPSRPSDRCGTLKMTTANQMPSVKDAGMYPRHLHLEPGSELSLSDSEPLQVISATTAGGYGNLHGDLFVKANGIVAPGRASLMESDCRSGAGQGRMTVGNLTMEADAVLRISIGRNQVCYDDDGASVDGPCSSADVLVVRDSVFMKDKVSLYILPEMEQIDEGCYLILEYGDTLSGGLSAEYVKHLTLVESRFGDVFFGLDFSTPGKVYLCVTQFPTPVIQRYVDLPAVAGVTTYPGGGTHYVRSNKDFTFTARFTGAPLRVTAKGVYSGNERLLDSDLKALGNNTYEYRIRRIVEPWIISIGPGLNNDVGNESIDVRRVWSHGNRLYINAETDEVVHIYNMTGALYRKIDLPAGSGQQTFLLERGIYVVTLKDGSTHKVVIK
jgi:hypothetical protein